MTRPAHPVTAAQLEAVAAMAPREQVPAHQEHRLSRGQALDLDAWLAEHPLDLLGPSSWLGGRKWVFRVCPWNPDHRDRSAYLAQFPSGAVAAGCHHNGCAGKDWHALRDLLEPGRREPYTPHALHERRERWDEPQEWSEHSQSPPARQPGMFVTDKPLVTDKVTKVAPSRSRNGFSHFGLNSPAPGGGTLTEELADAVAEVPDLPDEAAPTADALRMAEAARAVWLERYIEAARHLSPRTPRSLHEAAGLFALATAIARRAYVQAGSQRLYPALYLAFVGRSTLYSKTTGLGVLRLTLELAGLQDLLLPASFTPQALLADLALHVPPSIKEGTEGEQQAWLEQHRHGAQRAIIRDELAGLFEDCTKDYNVGLLPLLLKLDGAPERMDPDLTLSRGLVAVRQAAINLIGATTPAAFRSHAVKPYHWTNGLFGRFALIAPGEPPAYAFWSESVTSAPAPVVQGLRQVDEAFPRPVAQFTYLEAGKLSSPAKDDGPRIAGAIQEGYGALQCRVDRDAREAWRRYDQALFGLAGRPEAKERLDPTYGRLPSAAIRMALILAATEWAQEVRRTGVISSTVPTVTLGHWAAAQEIAERWRRDAHAILAAALREEDGDVTTAAATRLMTALSQEGGRLSRRDALRRLHCTAAHLDSAIQAAGGRVRDVKQETGGRPAEWLELTPDAAQPPAMSETDSTAEAGRTSVTKVAKAISQERGAPALVSSGVTKAPDPATERQLVGASAAATNGHLDAETAIEVLEL